ncbi:sensor histidine kinase [Caballeronia sordidicola]|uniref:histidine kinase n=1 Tax=Caballeronia sordidicola TaxID=196367 RepID=A0A226X7D4_CABSO|nr:HAMP domain-containing sensor histidine kinase [Caballeronia sordidicola]OXC79351.1 Two-component hybrid sensor and regulator [Caballeronia sordidicola]
MMHEFLANNRQALIERCRAKVAQRPARAATAQQLQNGVPLFLEQIIRTLRVEQTDEPMEGRKISGPSNGAATRSEVGATAAQHGRELLKLGFSVDQVVHDYGDLCQAITDLAYERDAPFEVDEFRTLNRCLDNAIADAVTEFSYQRDDALEEEHAREAKQQQGFFAQELRNLLSKAALAFAAVKTGNLNVNGATGSVLERSLTGLRDMIDQSLAEVRVAAGKPVQSQMFSVAEFIAEVKYAADLAAQVRGCVLTVSPVDGELAVSGDRDLLYSAVGNLLQNAFAFTHSHTEVTLNAYAVADRVLIDVTDHCGGLRAGDAEKMFLPFTLDSADKSGLRLGLSIARRGVESSDGALTVRNIPDTGCVFTISLPRYAMTGR